MYNLPYFKARDEKEVIDFMHQHPFVVLTGCGINHLPVATHVPVLIEERGDKLFLLGHMMRHTGHHKALIENSNVLVIFSAPHAYISASWYQDHKQASTWNYQAVHASGKLQFLPEDSLLKILRRTTSHFENNPASPSLVEHLPPDYINRLMKAIIAFEIEVTALDHVFKMSQNKDKESYLNIIEHLEKGDAEAQQVASVMERNVQDGKSLA
jgi:transcriptional regulator